MPSALDDLIADQQAAAQAAADQHAAARRRYIAMLPGIDEFSPADASEFNTTREAIGLSWESVRADADIIRRARALRVHAARGPELATAVAAAVAESKATAKRHLDETKSAKKAVSLARSELARANVAGKEIGRLTELHADLIGEPAGPSASRPEGEPAGPSASRPEGEPAGPSASRPVG